MNRESCRYRPARSRGRGVAKQHPPAVVWEFVEPAPASINTRLVAGVDENGVDCSPTGLDALDRGCEQASCVLSPIAQQRFGRERGRAVAETDDLDGASLRVES